MLDWENVDEVKKKLNEQASLDGVLNHKFQYFLSILQNQGTHDMVLFSFEDCKVVYSRNMDAMIEYKLTSKWNKNLLEMKV